MDSASQCPSSINLRTLFGCWLQYPAVYWFHNESDYSLDMEKLTQYIVTSERWRQIFQPVVVVVM